MLLPAVTTGGCQAKVAPVPFASGVAASDWGGPMPDPIVTVASPDAPAASVAVTTTSRPEGPAAVNRPDPVIVSPDSPVRFQLTLPDPGTVNCWDPPGCTMAAEGVTVSGE